MVQINPELKKGHKLYTGYFNYRILADSSNTLKTYYFEEYPASMVKKMRKQLKDVNTYHFYGGKSVRVISEKERL